MLVLDNCELTDDKLSVLAPLTSKFHTVALNGEQKITLSGWSTFSEVLRRPECKIKKLELKIVKSEEQNLQLTIFNADSDEKNRNIIDCKIDDPAMDVLAPALVNIKEVHLIQNGITAKGWSTLKKAWMVKMKLTYKPPQLSILDLSLRFVSLHQLGTKNEISLFWFLVPFQKRMPYFL